MNKAIVDVPFIESGVETGSYQLIGDQLRLLSYKAGICYHFRLIIKQRIDKRLFGKKIKILTFRHSFCAYLGWVLTPGRTLKV